MKKKNTVLIYGITAIVILISVQVFIIKGVWQQKNELFAIRYTINSQEALNTIYRRMNIDPFDTVKLLPFSSEGIRE